MRIGKKRVRVPVLVTLGVCADGRRVVLDLRIAGEESEASWSEVLRSLVARNVGVPVLAVVDGNPSLEAALRSKRSHAPWARLRAALKIQRCTNHKLWNLFSKAPAHLREELGEKALGVDYDERAVAGMRVEAMRRGRSFEARLQLAPMRVERKRQPVWSELLPEAA